MPRYEFVSVDKNDLDENGMQNIYEIGMSMADAPSVGAKIKSPDPAVKGFLIRIVSRPQIIAKEPIKDQLKNVQDGQVLQTRIGDKNVNFEFIDHHPNKIAKAASAAASASIMPTKSGIGQAYFSEKHNQYVVDVKSNIADPLGAIEKNKRQGNVDVTTTKVNQGYQTRKKGKK